MGTEKAIKESVRHRYSELASSDKSYRPSCSCGVDPIEQAISTGYSPTKLENVPASAVMGLGCGNPTALADMGEGETVLDLGMGSLG